ncbi:hypothetical protein DFQ26_001297 [Actinomortierella ambigua]|nr:hypothetical protein DFQ26_001297 [Actinomortierella ambigua]
MSINWKVGCIVHQDNQELKAFLVKDKAVMLLSLSPLNWQWRLTFMGTPFQGYEGFYSQEGSGEMACAADPVAGFIVLLRKVDGQPQGLLFTKETKDWTVLAMDAKTILSPVNTSFWPVKDGNSTTFMYGSINANNNRIEFGSLKNRLTLTPAPNSWALDPDTWGDVVSLNYAGGYLSMTQERGTIYLSRRFR